MDENSEEEKSENSEEESSEDENEEGLDAEEKERRIRHAKTILKAISIGTRFQVAPRSYSVTKEFKKQTPSRSGKLVLTNMSMRKFPIAEMKKCELDKVVEYISL